MWTRKRHTHMISTLYRFASVFHVPGASCRVSATWASWAAGTTLQRRETSTRSGITLTTARARRCDRIWLIERDSSLAIGGRRLCQGGEGLHVVLPGARTGCVVFVAIISTLAMIRFRHWQVPAPRRGACSNAKSAQYARGGGGCHGGRIRMHDCMKVFFVCAAITFPSKRASMSCPFAGKTQSTSG